MQAIDVDLPVKLISFSYPYHNKTYFWNGMEVFSMNLMHLNKGQRVLAWWKIWKKMSNLKKQYQIQSMVSFWIGETSLLGSWFSWWHHIPFYAWICGQDAKPGNRFARLSKLNPENTVAISDFIRDGFQKHYGIKPIYTIPFGVSPTPTNLDFKHRPIDIIGVGSLKPLKQFHLFIEAVALIQHKHPQIKVLICGSGESHDALLELIVEKGLERQIQLLGEVMHHETIQLMSQSKIMLHSSNYEGMSAACLESLEAGCQLISFVKSMDVEIEHWQIASSVEDMAQKAMAILDNPPAETKRVMPYSIFQTATTVLEFSKR
jgi:glycosyltransferase involved in cell wall biosynthesis